MTSAACDFGGASRSPINPSTPTTPGAPGPPRVSITGVLPAGATPTYTVWFTVDAGTGCGQGLVGGGALTLDDGTIQDSVDTNGSSGIPAFSVDGTCSFSTMANVPPPQRLESLPNVSHVVAITVYLSPPSSDTLGDPPMHHPTLSDAIVTSRYATNLYLVGAHPTPGMPNVEGVWKGTIQDSIAGTGSLVVSLAQNGGTGLYGGWSVTFSRSQFNLIGSIVGVVDATSVTLLLTPGGSACPLVMRWTLNGSAAATGTYGAASGCSLTPNGTVTLSRT